MASSTSIVPGADDTAPSQARLDTLAAQAEAIDRLVGLARSRLLVFDRDLSEVGWSGLQRATLLAAFLKQRAVRLSIIVHDTRFIEAACPRLISLLRSHGHAMEVWRTGPAARGVNDALVIADERHALHRYHVDQPRATLTLAMPQQVQPLVARFEEIWATGEPGLGGSVLGL